MPHIIIKNIRKTYDKGRVVANDDIDLEVYDKEYLTLLGPSGCGKTTLLRLIARLIEPDSGEIYFDGKLVTKIPPEDRDIGMVFQHFEIFPFMDVWDNVAYSGRVKKWSENKIEDETIKALKMVNLLHRAEDFPDDLSDPELQRVGIARALASGSKLLLLDEPLGALDQRYRDEFRQDLRRLVNEFGLTAIHVTHDQDEAMMISDRIAVMRKGVIFQVGTPSDLYVRPNSIFVANFIGESNFLDGEIINIKDEGSEIVLRANGPRIITKNKDFKIGQRVITSIRKELVKIMPRNIENPYAIEAKIVDIAFLGSYLRLHCELHNGDRIEAKVTYPTKFPVNKSDIIQLKLHPENLLAFKYPADLEYELALE
ncbi:MAG: ABC transporter ATP-binding protein [Candidatus Helarchaeota archaeon]